MVKKINNRPNLLSINHIISYHIMKKLFIFSLFALLSCSKQDADCDLNGTWRQVISLPIRPELFAGNVKLESDGSMVMMGITGFQYRTGEECGVFEYWHKSEKSITVEMKILRNDGLYLELELLTGTLDPVLNPLGISGNMLLKKEK